VNFSGWVPVRRGILEHMASGQLSTQEAMALTVLILLADSSTGRGLINAAAIRTWIPGLKYEDAKEVLKALQDKGYIYRQIRHGSKALYPYWVAKYEPTTGRYKGLLTVVTKALDTNDARDIVYKNQVPETRPDESPDSPPETTLEAPRQRGLNNNKEKNKKNDKKKDTPILTEGCASTCADRVSAEHISVQRDAHLDDSGCTHGLNVVSTWPQNDVAVVAHHQGVGLRWDGQFGFEDIKSNSRVSLPTVVQRVTAINLEYRNGQFFDAKGQPIPTNAAQRLLSGIDERNAA